MKAINLYVFLILCVKYLSLALVCDNKQCCFQYTWVASTANNPEKYNCTKFKGVPCIEPVIISEEPPNAQAFWDNRLDSTQLFCSLTSGNVCIKYTFMYNNHPVNSSMFCGKVIEDQAAAITEGCYQQNVEGHTVSVCTCQTRKGQIPCNATMKIKYSITLIATNLVFVILKSIY